MTKEQLLRECVAAYEQFIEAAALAEQQGVISGSGSWGPRAAVAHMVGWEVMASVRIPKIVAGMVPMEFPDPTQQEVMNDALNAAFITLAGEQPLATLCNMLRRAYQQNIELLDSLDDALFRPGEYVYERTKDVVEHCQEHREQLVP